MDINDLPYEMITSILGYLCSHSLESAILTCKLWKQIIDESCFWQWDVNLTRLGKWRKYSQITKRKFYKFSIIDTGSWKINYVVDILKLHGSNVVDLYMSRYCSNLNRFLEILNCLPKLSHLELVNTELSLWSENLLPIETKELRSIKIFASHAYNNFSNDTTPASLKYLLKSQKHLKSLSIHSEYEGVAVGGKTYLQALDRSMPFQLTHLSLVSRNLEFIDCNELLGFLELQAPTTTALELRGPFPEVLYMLALSDFKKLKSLRLGIANLPKDQTFYMHLKPNDSITTLTLVETFILDDSNETLFSTCPQWFKELIRCVPKVTGLSLCARCSMETISFLLSSLKLVSLNIEDLEVDADWTELIRGNRQIKELTVYFIRRDVSVGIVDAIQELLDSIKPLKLDTLRIGRRLRLSPVYQSSMEDGHWTDVDWWIDGKCCGSFANKLVDLRLTIETWGRCYSRIKGGKNVIELEREVLRHKYYDRVIDVDFINN